MKGKRLLTILTGVLITSGTIATAETATVKPIQLSLTPDAAVYNRSTTIKGFSLGIWSENPQQAFALGIVNGSTGQSAGLSLAFILNYADSYTGVQWAPVNYTSGDFLGWQLGLVNYTGGFMKGLQTGAVNCADSLTGLQFGFVNYAKTAESGVQIGLINIISDNQWFSEMPDELAPGMILVNWSF
jgi:hypothetical protein